MFVLPDLRRALVKEIVLVHGAALVSRVTQEIFLIRGKRRAGLRYMRRANTLHSIILNQFKNMPSAVTLSKTLVSLLLTVYNIMPKQERLLFTLDTQNSEERCEAKQVQKFVSLTRLLCDLISLRVWCDRKPAEIRWKTLRTFIGINAFIFQWKY